MVALEQWISYNFGYMQVDRISNSLKTITVDLSNNRVQLFSNLSAVIAFLRDNLIALLLNF